MSDENIMSNVTGPVTIRGLVHRSDGPLVRRVEALELALQGLVLELVEHGSLPPDPPREQEG